jgi:hypothetical protein
MVNIPRRIIPKRGQNQDNDQVRDSRTTDGSRLNRAKQLKPCADLHIPVNEQEKRTEPTENKNR